MPLHEPQRPIESRSAEQPRIAGQRLGADGVPAEVPCTYWTRLVVTARVHTIFFNISESRGAIRHNVSIPTDWAALSLYLVRGAPGSAEWVLK
jgi:hypothetical protein